MAEIADTVSEAVEHAAGDRLNTIIAICVSLAATFMALCNVKNGNIVQRMAQAQAHSIDSWGYYQAKGTKQNLAEATIDQLAIQRELDAKTLSAQSKALLDQKITQYQAAVKKYEAQKAEIKKEAEGYQKEYDTLNLRDDQFDLSEAAMSVSIALFGVTALTRKKWLLAVAGAFVVIGVVYGTAGLFGLGLHSELMTRFLG